jgi:hypothetical protein
MLVALQESESEEGAVPLEDPDFQVGAFPGHVPEEVRSVLVFAFLRAAVVFVCRNLGLRQRKRPMGSSLRHMSVILCL